MKSISAKNANTHWKREGNVLINWEEWYFEKKARIFLINIYRKRNTYNLGCCRDKHVDLKVISPGDWDFIQDYDKDEIYYDTWY